MCRLDAHQGFGCAPRMAAYDQIILIIDQLRESIPGYRMIFDQKYLVFEFFSSHTRCFPHAPSQPKPDPWNAGKTLTPTFGLLRQGNQKYP
jgi:hypothetical protein